MCILHQIVLTGVLFFFMLFETKCFTKIGFILQIPFKGMEVSSHACFFFLWLKMDRWFRKDQLQVFFISFSISIHFFTGLVCLASVITNNSVESLKRFERLQSSGNIFFFLVEDRLLVEKRSTSSPF